MRTDNIVPPKHGMVVINDYYTAVASIDTLLSWTDTWEKTLEFRRLLRRSSEGLREVKCGRHNFDGNR